MDLYTDLLALIPFDKIGFVERNERYRPYKLYTECHPCAHRLRQILLKRNAPIGMYTAWIWTDFWSDLMYFSFYEKIKVKVVSLEYRV